MNTAPRHPIRPGDGDARHGSTGGYTNHGCRCPACTEAHSVAVAGYMARHPEQRRAHRERELAAYYAGRRSKKPPGRQ